MQNCLPNPGISIVTVGRNCDRGWDQTCCWVLAVEDNSVDAAIVVVEPPPDVGLRMIHGACDETLPTDQREHAQQADVSVAGGWGGECDERGEGRKKREERARRR